jgi:hypothetical protein
MDHKKCNNSYLKQKKNENIRFKYNKKNIEKINIENVI